MKNVTLSVSIVIYETDETQLRNCLDSLAKSLAIAALDFNTFSWTLDIVCNSEPPSWLRQSSFQNLSIICNNRNVGFGRAHNQSALSSTSDWHLILNPDVELDSKCLQELLTIGVQEPGVVAIAPRGFTSSGEDAYLCKRFPSILTLLIRGFGTNRFRSKYEQRLSSYEYHDLDNLRATVGIELASGCCILTRTSSFKAIQGFDTGFFLYFEDYDLSIRLSELGDIAYQPAAKIIHHGGNTAGKGIAHILHFSKSAVRFFVKHRKLAR